MSQFKNILSFLKELSAHNHKEWMDANKNWYQEARGEFIAIVDQLISGISGFDPSIEGLKAKDCIFRINRDVRFSGNKDPYKTNFGASMAPGGRHSGKPLYYFHLEPEKSFTAGGVYMPEADVLAKIRQEIDYSPKELLKVIENPAFIKKFNGLEGEKLKTAPKGYAKDHPHVELLKHKSYIISRKVSDTELLKSDVIASAVDDYQAMLPLNQFLSRALS